MWKDIKLDLERYCHRLQLPSLTIILFQAGFHAAVVYRIGHAIVSSHYSHTLPFRILWMFYSVVRRISEVFTGINFNPEIKLGPGVYMPHFGGIVLYGDIGSNCDIHQGVTVGYGGHTVDGTPVIGDRVFLGAGAKIIGSITVGNDVVIGANAVVTKSVPDRAVVVGIPAKIVSMEGSFDFVRYPDMENDPERQNSLALLNSDDDMKLAHESTKHN